jgi:hypothetical protein
MITKSATADLMREPGIQKFVDRDSGFALRAPRNDKEKGSQNEFR